MTQEEKPSLIKKFINPTELIVAFIFWPVIVGSIPVLTGHAGKNRGGGYTAAALAVGFLLAPVLFGLVKFAVLVVIVPKRELTGIAEYEIVHKRVKQITGWLHMAILALCMTLFVMALKKEGVW